MNKTTRIRDELLALSDKKYSEFSSALIPGVNNMIGVRIPVLREIAKKIALDNPMEYINSVVPEYFEEKMLKALIIAYMKLPMEDLYELLEAFIPEIDNWSINDSLCTTLKQVRKYRKETWDYLSKYFNSEKEFENRFANIMLMSHFLTEEYISKVLAVYSEFHHDGYYAKMGVAWAVATAFAKFPGQTMKFMKEWNVDAETYNMAIRKMQESFRVSNENKKILKNMKK